jgi:4-aminobutyrate aminotransferase/(S)-3-amino-2-methylpropionate transaminase
MEGQIMLVGTELAEVGKGQGEKTKKLLEKKTRYISRGIPTTHPIFVDEAKGAVVRDLDGNTYLDLYAGIGVLNAGHRPDPVVDAIKKQSDKCLHTSFPITHYEPYVALAEKLTAITPGHFEKKAMFVNSGAEAVENAVKIARAYTKKPGIISFEAGFHGRTLLTMTLTSKVKPYKFGFGPFAPEVYKIPSAYCYRCVYHCTYPECEMHCVEHCKRFFVSEVDPANVAAMIIEPVQGEGGFIVPPPEFLPGLKKICDDNGILFIADEIQSGFARTGKMFAVENFGVEPDLVVMAKSIASGMVLSAVVGKAEIMDGPEPAHIGGTYGGNPVACAAGLATLDYVEKERLTERALRIGDYVVGKLREMEGKYPQIGEIRSLGAMIGVEFVKTRDSKEPAKKETSAIINECFKRGLLVLGAGIFSNVIRMLMPLVITDEQLDQSMSIFENSCEVVLKG